MCLYVWEERPLSRRCLSDAQRDTSMHHGMTAKSRWEDMDLDCIPSGAKDRIINFPNEAAVSDCCHGSYMILAATKVRRCFKARVDVKEVKRGQGIL